ncbi:3-oxoacyl-ACP synthase [Winogradskyella sp. DF17]|uniref:3-oxoacyl-ACP synthase n=1 Tax=Winogradskyella pelagia TaxID=2819984 RepID=A0ABS3SXS7_9FLAO|nr:3-oxoacyl-ACP synthase [Winogradskyella sp. DF17]
MNLKQRLTNICQKQIQLRLERIKSKIRDLHEALNSEAKSSAGDKHETGRAMIQLEREKLGFQLAEIEQIIKTVQRIDTSELHTNARLGSVVFTTQFNYFIAASCGEIDLDNTKFYTISSAAPLAQLLLSKKQGDVFEFRGNEITILKIV